MLHEFRRDWLHLFHVVVMIDIGKLKLLLPEYAIYEWTASIHAESIKLLLA